MYRVFIGPDGDYCAHKVASDPNATDFATRFQAQDWTVFTTELRHRLIHEAQTLPAETSLKTRRKGDAEIF